ncbi:MAG: hypothetical protein OXG04_18980 [Acidobacteria bacterium]|nr:hypothetical protein [Acidobacteriota bacterium]
MHSSRFRRRLLSLAVPALLAAPALAALAASVALANSVLPMSFSEVVESAEVVAAGTVTAINETWDAEQEAPFTEVTFSNLDVVKGQVGGEELTLHFLGGPDPDGYVLVVSGMPQFEVGDRAVVFSAGNGVQISPLVGWSQGLYRLFYDPGQDAFTVADHVGRAVVAIENQEGRMESRLSTADNDETIPDALTLDEFLDAVREALP